MGVLREQERVRSEGVVEEKERVIVGLSKEIADLKLMHQQELFILKRKDRKEK